MLSPRLHSRSWILRLLAAALLVVSPVSLAACSDGLSNGDLIIPLETAGHRRLLSAISISNVRSGPDGSAIAVDLADATSSVPKGTATADAVGVTALKGRAGSAAAGASSHQSSSGHNAGASAGVTAVSVMQGFAKAAKAPAKGAAKTATAPLEAATRSEPALKPEEYPDWVSDLVTPGKTLGELKRMQETARSMLEDQRMIKLSQRASIKATNFSKAKGV